MNEFKNYILNEIDEIKDSKDSIRALSEMLDEFENGGAAFRFEVGSKNYTTVISKEIAEKIINLLISEHNKHLKALKEKVNTQFTRELIDLL